VCTAVRNGRDERRRGGTRADHDDLLAVEIEVIGPCLRMHEPALEPIHSGPFGRVTFRVSVIALAHPKELGADLDGFGSAVGSRASGCDLPASVSARPLGRLHRMAIANVTRYAVLVDDFAEVGQDLGGRRKRRALPGLESVAEGEEVAVGAHPRIAMRAPGAPEARLRLQHDERLGGTVVP